MNRLKTNIDGGFPLRLDDFRWTEEANKEALTGLVRALIGSEDGAKLYGCVVVDTEQGDIWTCSEGFIYMNDEIFYVAEQSIENTGTLWFEELVTYDASGNKTFEDASTNDTYEIRRAQLATGASAPADTLAYNAPNVQKLLNGGRWQSQVLNSNNVTSPVADGGSISAISGTMRYRVQGSTMVCCIELDVTTWYSDGDAPESILIGLPTVATIYNGAGSVSNAILDMSGNSRSDGHYHIKADAALNKLVVTRVGSEKKFADQLAHSFKGQITIEIT